MKTKISIFFILILLAAVGVSGCLSPNGPADTPDIDANTSDVDADASDIDASRDVSRDVSLDNSSSENSSSAGNGSSGSSNVMANPIFHPDLTLVDSIPASLTFLSTVTVKSHGQNIGITDALYGYQGIYLYNDDNAFLTIYNTNSSQEARDYLQMMQTSHAQTYGSNSKVETVQINGHDAVLLTTSEMPNGQYILAWTVDQMIVVVNGPVDYSLIRELAEASRL
ncbi:MAG: DUF4367 domain-containing protein [Methanimicrococcus sp.]|nr:DUF4367 domain-containing protein [Methanimicrococcus sp.]